MEYIYPFKTCRKPSEQTSSRNPHLQYTSSPGFQSTFKLFFGYLVRYFPRMSSPTPIQPFQYHPISFVSPISDTTHTQTSPHTSRLRRLSTYLKNAVTLEDTATAWRRESVISDQGNMQQEISRRSSTSEQENSALLAWRRGSEEGFWKKYGIEGRRKSSVNGEGERRLSLGRAGGKGKWRKMSWVGRE
ncbi:hypothetical protein HBH76_141320 [Parastagonospora nodorum]|nr:hypothetical protein HBH76_141320 [Parastagonospora nodorum]